MGGAIRGLSVIILVAAFARAADVRVLATTGVRLNGFGIAAIERPIGAPDGVVFRGVRTSVEIAGRTFASGDPLPAPLTGTIEEIQQGVTASYVGAFVTAANGPDAAWGIFLVEGTNVSPVVRVGAAESISLRALTMNGNGDLAYNVITTTGPDRLVFRPRATGEPTTIAESKRLSTLRGFTMDAAGAVAWMDSRGSVFHWDVTHGVRVVDDNRRRPVGTIKAAVALHPAYGLVYATRDAVNRWDPGTGTGATLLQRRAEVAGQRVRRIYGDVGFLDDGSVTVRISSSTVLCLGPVPWVCNAQGKTGSADAIAPRRQGGVFRMRNGSTDSVVRPGDILGGDGQLDDVAGHAVAGTTVAFVGTLSDQRDVLGRSRNGRLERLAVDGQQVDGRTLDLETTIYDARGKFVVVAASLLDPDDGSGHPLGIALVRNAGDVRPLVAPRGKRFVAAFAEDAVVAGDRAVVRTSDPNAFVSGRGRTKPVLVERRKGLSFSGIAGPGMLGVNGSRIIFPAVNADDEVGLYELDGRTTRRVAVLRAAPTLLASDGDDAAFLATVLDEDGVTFTSQLWVVSEGSTRALVRGGDPTPLGAIASIDALALTSRDVVFVATLAGDDARHALLAVAR